MRILTTIIFSLALGIPSEWEVLGPFPHGSKEIGVDPLSLFGGFENLQYNTDDKYPSELATGGFVKWTKISTSSDGKVGPIYFDNVNWDMNLYPFGWAILQHATYLRGSFEITEEGIYLARFNGVASFKIDATTYPGNLYGFEHAADSKLFLSKGSHKVYICLVQDIRVHGTEIPPKPTFSGVLKKVESDYNGIIAYPQDTILPEGYKGKMLSLVASFVLKNTNSFKPMSNKKMGLGLGWKQVLGVNIESPSGEKIPCSITTRFTIYIAPGQIVAVPIRLDNEDYTTLSIKISVDFLDLDTEQVLTIPIGDFKMYERTDIDSEYKITFEGYDHTIQYAFAKPPKKGCQDYTLKKCPVIVALHGTNYFATSKDWLDSVGGQDYAWVLFPSGRTKW